MPARSAQWGAALAALVILLACGDDAKDDGPPGGPIAGNPQAGSSAVGVPCGTTTCPVGQVCNSNGPEGVCIQTCSNDSDCVGGPCCGATCASVSNDRNNCGGCGTICAATESCTDGTCTPLMCSGMPGTPIATPPSPAVDAGTSGSEEDGGVASEPPATMSTLPPTPPAVIAANGCAPNEQCVIGNAGPTCKCGTGASCPSDQQCSASGACMCGSAPACAGGEACCGDYCADLASEGDNCGRCGASCRGETTCQGGVCACATDGESLCGDACIDLDTDAANCGACGTKCLADQSCTDGACVCTDPAAIPCGDQCIVADDDAHCGSCDNACEGQTHCTSDDTHPLDCYCPNFNQIACDGVCVDPSTNRNHCGSCDNACDGPASVCRSGRCECPDPMEAPCGDSCQNLRTGVDEGGTINHCGKCDLACDPGAACDAGECDCPGQAASFKYCDEDPQAGGAKDGDYECVDAVDSFNCYACGRACLGASSCSTSAMGCVCDDATLTYCDDRCLSTDTSADHCGACGRTCPSGVSCVGGDCNCPGGQTLCAVGDALECVSTSANDDHCGGCGITCSGSETCCGGACRAASWFAENVDNCGTCGTVCPPRLLVLPPSCSNGTCQ